MSCPTCSATPCGGTCDSCGSYVSVENGAVQPVRTATAIRVSDRNGLPRGLITIPSSIPAADRNGVITNRDGSASSPLNLAQLRQILAATGGVIVIDGNGDLALLPKSDLDAYLASVGGVVTWTNNLPRTNIFNESDLAPFRGKIVTLGCSGDGQISLGFLDMTSADYIGVDSEGKPVPKTFCDATTVVELDSIFGCSSGTLSKIVGAANKKLVFNEEGKLVLVDDVSEETWVGSNAIWTKVFDDPTEQQYDEVTVNFGASVPDTAKWVQLGVLHSCGASGTFGETTVYINGFPVIYSRMVWPFGSYEGSVILYVPYGDGNFTVNGTFTIRDLQEGDTGHGSINIRVLSYK